MPFLQPTRKTIFLISHKSMAIFLYLQFKPARQDAKPSKTIIISLLYK